MIMERTLILVKPDGVKKNLIGEVLTRFERVGLKMVALKMAKPSRDFIGEHYGNDPKWVAGMGGKTLENYKQYGIDPFKEFGTDDPLKIGKEIREWLLDFMSSGPVVAAVFEGNHAVDIAKKVAGHTLPLSAAPGTIRGDFSVESADLANAEKRAIQNLVHISGNLADAAHEVPHWFPELK